MKDPAFLFYPNDYIGGTMGMTFEQKGAYIELLMTQFNRGHMTSHMIGQVLGQHSGQLWDTIKDKFIQDEEGLYYNARLEIEQIKRKQFTDSRKNNLEGKNQYSKNKGHKQGHKTTLMENRNRDENSSSFLSNLPTTLKEQEFNFEILKQNTQYLQSIYRATVTVPKRQISYRKFLHLTDIFIADQSVKSEMPKNEMQYRDHFVNWMKIQTCKNENWDEQLVL